MFTKEKTNQCKGVAILFLLFHHLFRTEKIIESHNMQFFFLDVKTAAIIGSSLRVCVWIFAFLSAYGLSYKYINGSRNNSKGGETFVAKQWLSLMKPYWIVFFLNSIIYSLGHSLTEKYEHNLMYFVLDFFGLANLFEKPMLLGVHWYMCFAQIVVLCIPLVVCFVEKQGYLSIPLTYIIIRLMPIAAISSANSGDYMHYIPIVVCGVVFADKDVMNRLSGKSFRVITRVLLAISAVVICVVSLYYQNALIQNDTWRLRGLLNALAALSVVLTIGVFLDCELVGKPLRILGKYSGLIFLIHAALYSFIPNIVYVSKYAELNYLVLIAESLLISICIDRIRGIVANRNSGEAKRSDIKR